MKADFRAVIDACVLANFSVADLLLRLAEKPRLYLPCWSDEILAETRKTHLESLRWPPHLAESFELSLRKAYPEALISGYQHLVDHCGNEPKDRHVLACAIHAKAEVILTFNLKDFPDHALSTWGVYAKHPQDYLITLFELEPLQVMHVLGGIVSRRRCRVEDHLIDLGRFLPNFSTRILDELST